MPVSLCCVNVIGNGTQSICKHHCYFWHVPKLPTRWILQALRDHLSAPNDSLIQDLCHSSSDDNHTIVQDSPEVSTQFDSTMGGAVAANRSQNHRTEQKRQAISHAKCVYSENCWKCVYSEYCWKSVGAKRQTLGTRKCAVLSVQMKWKKTKLLMQEVSSQVLRWCALG